MGNRVGVASNGVGNGNESVVTYVVIVEVFDGGDGEYADERHGRGHRCQRRDGRYELQHQKAGEVEVGQPVELLEEIQRQERHQCVLRRLYVIVLQ